MEQRSLPAATIPTSQSQRARGSIILAHEVPHPSGAFSGRSRLLALPEHELCREVYRGGDLLLVFAERSVPMLPGHESLSPEPADDLPGGLIDSGESELQSVTVEAPPPVGTTPPATLVALAARGKRGAAWRLLHWV